MIGFFCAEEVLLGGGVLGLVIPFKIGALFVFYGYSTCRPTGGGE